MTRLKRTTANASRSLLVCIALGATLLLPSFAHATVAFVELTSPGKTGIKCDTYVSHRFPNLDEGYFVDLDNADASNYNWTYGFYPFFAWEIYQFEDLQNETFYPCVHIGYDEPDTAYANDQYFDYYFDRPVSAGGTWHNMRVKQTNPGVSNHFACYIDDSWYENYYWPYPTNNYPYTAQEAFKIGYFPPDLGPNDAQYMGRNQAIYFANGSGQWVLQGSSYGGSITSRVEDSDGDPSSYYYVEMLTNYSDFRGRR